MKRSTLSFGLYVLVTAVGLTGQMASSQPYRYYVTEMPVTATYNASGAYALNRDGSVVGYMYAGNTGQAFVWRPITNNNPSGTQLGLGQTTGGTFSVASSISNNSKIAGYSVDGSGQRFMTTWNVNTGVASPLVSITGSAGNGLGINDSGKIAFNNDGAPWVFDSGISTILNCSYGAATAINQAGDVAGGGNNGVLSSYQGDIWEFGSYGVANNVGMIFGGIFRDSGALYAINSQRRTTGYVVDVVPRAYIWDFGIASPAFILPAGVYSSGYGVNEQGDVVGSYRSPQGQYGKPFLFESGVFVDLQGEIDPANGWYLTDAFDINEFGQICGFGYLNGQPRGYLLTPVPTNQPPVAMDDFYGMDQLQTLNQGAPGITANDSDPDNDALSVELISGPAHASSFQVNSDGSFTYTPVGYFTGTDTFTYRVFDGTAYSEPATVQITVQQPGSQGFITGGGKLLQNSQRFTLHAKVVGNGVVAGTLKFDDEGLSVRSNSVDWVYAPNSTDAYFSGTCSVNGVSGYTYFVQVHDRGEPGSSDDFSVWILDSGGLPFYTAGGQLSGGNIQIH